MAGRLRVKTVRADGAPMELYFQLDRRVRAPDEVEKLVEQLLKLMAKAGIAGDAEQVQALALALVIRTLQARPASRLTLDLTQEMATAAAAAARETETGMNRKIADIIRNQKVASLPPSASVRQAAKTMAKRNIGAIMVIDEDDELVGVFTERDMVKRVVAEGLDADKTPLEKVMTRNPKTMPSSESTLVALRHMRESGYRHLPIVDGGKLKGVVSTRDFVGAELKQLEIETAFRGAVMAEGYRPRA
jgi:CBS domain-containing protein